MSTRKPSRSVLNSAYRVPTVGSNVDITIEVKFRIHGYDFMQESDQLRDFLRRVTQSYTDGPVEVRIANVSEML